MNKHNKISFELLLPTTDKNASVAAPVRIWRLQMSVDGDIEISGTPTPALALSLTLVLRTRKRLLLPKKIT